MSLSFLCGIPQIWELKNSMTSLLCNKCSPILNINIPFKHYSKSIKRALKLAQSHPYIREVAYHVYMQCRPIYESFQLNMTHLFYCISVFPSQHILRNKFDSFLYCFFSLPETFLIGPDSLVVLAATLCQFVLCHAALFFERTAQCY